jgi:drug/metabolite transporter (DMT)-like permease
MAIVGAYFLMVPSLRISGVGITQSVGRLAVVVPVGASILMWGERPDGLRWVGLVLALVSFPLLARSRAVQADEGLRWRAPLLAGFFAVNGIMGVCQKAYAHETPFGGRPGFLCFLFGIAAVVMMVAAARERRWPDCREAVHGLALGMANVGANFSVLSALAYLPGTVVFPTTSAAVIMLTSILAVFLWRERFDRKAMGGMALAIAAIVLINLRDFLRFLMPE